MLKAMNIFAIGIALLSTIGTCFSDDVIEYDVDQEVINDETELVLELLSLPIVPERYKTDEFKKTWGITSPINAFHWDNCGGYAARVTGMTVSPDPIKLPGQISIGFHAVVNSTMDIPLFTNLTIEKKIGNKFIKIPCVEPFGSCTYEDLCQILDIIPKCPDALTQHGITCYCPFKTGTFNLPTSQFDAGSLDLPSGDYRIIGELYDHTKKLMACLALILSIA